MQGPRAQGGAQSLRVPRAHLSGGLGSVCLPASSQAGLRSRSRACTGTPATPSAWHAAGRFPATWPSRKRAGLSCAGRAAVMKQQSPSFSEGPTVEKQDRSLGTSGETRGGAPGCS